MDATGDTEQGTEATPHLACPCRLVGDLADDLEEGRFPRPVDADQPQCAPGLHLEADVLQHPAVVVLGRLGHRAAEAVELVVEERRRSIGSELLPPVSYTHLRAHETV